MSFFEQFRDLDKLKERAEALWSEGVEKTKRGTAVVKLKARVFELERRMNAEFRTLGERVWELHNDDALSTENLAGAFDTLEELAEEIAQTKEEIEELSSRGDDDLEEAPAPDEERELEPPPADQ